MKHSTTFTYTSDIISTFLACVAEDLVDYGYVRYEYHVDDNGEYVFKLFSVLSPSDCDMVDFAEALYDSGYDYLWEHENDELSRGHSHYYYNSLKAHVYWTWDVDMDRCAA